MAYAYPSPEGGSSSTLALSAGGYNAPGHTHSQGHGHGYGTSRKSSDTFDVLAEFKSKIEEDESYLGFFQERIRLEEEFITGLNRLYSRSKAVDTFHDDALRREEKPTTRRAWDEVRDYTVREIQSREAMVGALKEDIVKELVRLKEEQSRIRQGLRDNMKLAGEMYDDYAKGQLPRLKRSYWQKCQNVEDHKRQEHAITMQAKLLADSNTSPQNTPHREYPNAYSHLSPPTQSAPLPPSSNPAQQGPGLADSANFMQSPPAPPPSISFNLNPNVSDKFRERSSTASGRNRSGSGSAAGGGGGGGGEKTKEVLNDIAQQSKKGFNAIMQKLGGDKGDRDREDGGFVVVGSGGEDGGAGLQRRGTSRGDPSRGMGTMRGVKLKRDADEADKAYRLGVFHLESLRLRREKLHSSAVTNLEVFNDDLNKTLVKALEQYVDTLHGTAATNAQATEVARTAIEAVNLDRDTSLYRARLRNADKQKTAPVPYTNYYVGECRSLIFGVSLTDYDFARGEGGDRGSPPTIVERCIAAIDERGLSAEGIYRISGRHASVQKMIQDIELDEERYDFEGQDDVFSVSNVLKQYLRELPEPVFHLPYPERVKYTEHRETHIHSNFSALRGRLRRLPPIHQTTFQAVVEHLGRVQSHVTQTKMDAKNLAVVFNSVLFGQDALPADGNLLTMNLEKDTFLEDIITFSDLLFGPESEPQAPTLFPPGAALSRNGVISYHPVDDGPQPGSARTRVQIISPPVDAPPMTMPSVVDLTSETAYQPLPARRTSRKNVPAWTSPKEVQETLPVPTFTKDGELELLFDPKYIPASLREAVGSQYHVRPLASTDLKRSHFHLLQTLTTAPPLAPSMYKALFHHLQSCPETYFIVVVIDTTSDQMVAHGTLVVERKFIRGGSHLGHVEDIVVSPDVRGGGLGKKLVVGLKELGVRVGCYKISLNCRTDRIPFYEKCGFVNHGHQMAHYGAGHESAPSKTSEPSPTAHVVDTSQSNPESNALNLAMDDQRESENGSPKTFHSTSSGTGRVTYQFPVTSDQPAWAEEGLGSSVIVPSVHTSPVKAKDGDLAEEGLGLSLPPGAAAASSFGEPERLVRST